MQFWGRTWALFGGSIWIESRGIVQLLAFFDLGVCFSDLSLVYQTVLDLLC